MDLSIFLLLPFSVELVSLEWTLVGVSLVVLPAIRAFERVWAWFAFLCLEARRVHLLINLATPPKFTVVFGFVRAITLNTLGTLDSARKSHMTLLPAILTLGYA